MPSPLKCLRTWKFFHRFRSSPTPSSSSEPEISLGMQDDDDKLQEAFIPVEELKNILDEKPDAVLLVDCRAVEEYERKRIRHFNSCISIPVANLVPGVTTAEDILEHVKYISLQSLIHWGRRDRFEFIIVYDNWAHRWEECVTGLAVVYDALTKFDDKCKATKILLLQGGIQSVEAAYPEMIIENLLYADRSSSYDSWSDLAPATSSNQYPLEDKPKRSEDDHSRRYVIEDRRCLECPVCWILPVGQVIFQCNNGHVLCGQCLGKIEDARCPQCRVSMTEKKLRRNIALENVIQHVYLSN